MVLIKDQTFPQSVNGTYLQLIFVSMM